MIPPINDDWRKAREIVVEIVSSEVARCGAKAHEHVTAIAERVADRIVGKEKTDG